MALPTITSRRSAGRLEIKDNPALYWEFYFSFIVGGLVALFVIFTSKLSQTSTAIAVIVSAGALLIGLLLLMREAASIVILNRDDATLTVTRWTLFKRSSITRSLSDVAAAKVERGTLVRPTLVLTDGTTLPISNFWYKKDDASHLAVKEVNTFMTEARIPGQNVA
jgi:hypothetical protein